MDLLSLSRSRPQQVEQERCHARIILGNLECRFELSSQFQQ